MTTILKADNSCPPTGSIQMAVTDDDDGAGFSANEDDLTAKKVEPGKPCCKAAVKVGMRVYSFQGEVLSQEIWSTLKLKVKRTPKPWHFIFAPPAGGAEAAAAGYVRRCYTECPDPSACVLAIMIPSASDRINGLSVCPSSDAVHRLFRSRAG